MEIIDKLSLADYLWIRKLRNANCHLMTGNSRPVPLWRQILFWLRKPDNISLYLVRVGNERAGYLLLREFEPGCAYITECLSASFQGKQIGRQLVEKSQTLYQCLVADILPTNEASIRLHTRNGFVLESEQNGVLRYVWSKDSPQL